MLIVGIMGVYILPKTSNLSMSSYSGAQELIQAIRYAQQEAMDHTNSAGIGITIGANSFTFVGVTSPVDTWQLDPPPAYSVTFTRTGTITFDKRGVPSCTGALAGCATTAQPIGVVADGTTTTVTLEPYTGLAH